MSDLQDYIIKARELIEEVGHLDIVYLRVSTNDKGQEEKDQLPDIINSFSLIEKNCLIIEAKESAYQESKQERRILNTIIRPLIELEEFENVNKSVYIWDLDRLYRNQERQIEFIMNINKNNCIVLSYRQKFLRQLKEAHNGIGKAMYNFMIEVLAWQAEDESKKKADRLKKSLKTKDNRTYSNKNNLYGRKLIKSINQNGVKIYYSHKELDIIENIIKKLLSQGRSYQTIQQMFIDKKNIKISIGYIYNVKKKSL